MDDLRRAPFSLSPSLIVKYPMSGISRAMLLTAAYRSFPVPRATHPCHVLLVPATRYSFLRRAGAGDSTARAPVVRRRRVRR